MSPMEYSYFFSRQWAIAGLSLPGIQRTLQRAASQGGSRRSGPFRSKQDLKKGSPGSTPEDLEMFHFMPLSIAFLFPRVACLSPAALPGRELLAVGKALAELAILVVGEVL